MAILEEISLVGKNMKSLRKTIYRHFGPRNTGPSEELEVEDMFTISMASKSNTLAAPCNSFSTRMSNSAKNAWLESSFPSISGWRILTLWVIPSVTLHIWWKISTHWGNICADLSGHPGDIAATKLRELPFAFVPFVLAGPRWCGQHKNIEVGKKYRWWLCLFLFQDTQKTHLKQPYIYIYAHIDIRSHCPKTIVPFGFRYIALGAMPLIRGVAPKGPRLWICGSQISLGEGGIKSSLSW